MKYKTEIMLIIAATILTTVVGRWVNKYLDKVENKTGVPV